MFYSHQNFCTLRRFQFGQILFIVNNNLQIDNRSGWLYMSKTVLQQQVSH